MTPHKQLPSPAPKDEEKCSSCEMTVEDRTAAADSFCSADSSGSSHEHRLQGLVVEVPPDPELMSSCPNDSKHPLTILGKHKIRPGCHHVFEEWLRKVTQCQEEHFDGFLGAELIRPMNKSSTAAGSSQEYVSIFRYNSYENLQKWMKSSARAEMLTKTADFAEAPLRLTYHSLEFWFVRQRQNQDNNDNNNDDDEEMGGRTNDEQDQDDMTTSPPNARIPPPTYKMALVTFLVIWFLVHFVLPHGFSNIPGLAAVVIEMLNTALVVVLATWVGMPIAVRVLSFWLFPQEKYMDNLKELIPSFLRKCGNDENRQTSLGMKKEGE